MTERTTVYVTGKIYWAKIVGDQALHDNYDGDGKEWSFELAPDDEGAFLKEHKLLDRVKDKEDSKNPDKGSFIILKKPEFDKDGKKQEPFRVYDNTEGLNEPWDDRLIGNGTAVVAKLQIVDWGGTKKKSIYCQALRVETLVPYDRDEFAGYEGPSASTKAVGKAAKPKTKVTAELDELDDEIPF